MPDHPARLISNVTYLDDVGVTKRDIMMGVTNEEGGIFVSLGEFFGGVRNSTEVGRPKKKKKAKNVCPSVM